MTQDGPQGQGARPKGVATTIIPPLETRLRWP